MIEASDKTKFWMTTEKTSSACLCTLQNIGHLIFLFASAYTPVPLQDRSNVIMPFRLFSNSSPRKLSPSSVFLLSSDKYNSMHSVLRLCHFESYISDVCKVLQIFVLVWKWWYIIRYFSNFHKVFYSIWCIFKYIFMSV